MSKAARTTDTTMSAEMKSLLAPTVDSGSSWRDLFLLPVAALLLAMLIGALIMMQPQSHRRRFSRALSPWRAGPSARCTRCPKP